MAEFLLDDVFEISAVDPDGKKFDRVSRIQAKSDNYDMHLLLDVNIELFPLKSGQKFTLVLTKTIALDGVGTESTWRSEVATLADKYEYEAEVIQEWTRTGYTFDERMLLHRDPADDHPERPARIEGILQRFGESGLLARCVHVEAGEVPLEALKATHTVEHLQFIEGIPSMDVEMLMEKSHQMDSLYLSPDSEVGAKAAISCTSRIACDIALGRLRNGFALVRPPGHHAEPDRAMGFCLFNNVAVAVRELQRLGLARRVMILDWDVHHGNGTQRIFADDPNVLFISIHRHDDGKFYPSGFEGSPEFIGGETAMGRSINIGWNGPGANNADYLAAFRQIVMPTAFEFGPDFVIVSAGFDAADGDPIGDCQVTPYGFAQMTHQLMSLAGGRVLLVLEGGYNVPVIADCAEACLRTLVGDPIAYEQEQAAVSPSSVALQAMAATIRAQSPYWKSLYPRHHPVLETIFPCAVSLQGLCDAYWANVCQKEFRLIPLPIADGTLNSHFSNRIHISDNLLEHPSGIVVFAHEGGTMYSGNGDSNIIDLRNGILHQPFLGYLDEARNEDWAIVDIHTTTHKWRQKQNQTGASEDLTILNEMMLYLWDNFLALSDTLNVFFITSGLSAYSICNLMEKRITSQLVRGIVVLSPTLFLPVATAEKATWYAQNSLVIVPTRRPEGTAIPTNPSFGTCISSGSEEPLEINNTITRCQARVFSFIRERLNAS